MSVSINALRTHTHAHTHAHTHVQYVHTHVHLLYTHKRCQEVFSEKDPCNTTTFIQQKVNGITIVHKKCGCDDWRLDPRGATYCVTVHSNPHPSQFHSTLHLPQSDPDTPVGQQRKQS